MRSILTPQSHNTITPRRLLEEGSNVCANAPAESSRYMFFRAVHDFMRSRCLMASLDGVGCGVTIGCVDIMCMRLIVTGPMTTHNACFAGCGRAVGMQLFFITVRFDKTHKRNNVPAAFSCHTMYPHSKATKTHQRRFACGHALSVDE